MSELRYCPLCHKVFFWEIMVQTDMWCPNCKAWRDHNMNPYEEWTPNRDNDIMLRRVEL